MKEIGELQQSREERFMSNTLLMFQTTLMQSLDGQGTLEMIDRQVNPTIYKVSDRLDI